MRTSGGCPSVHFSLFFIPPAAVSWEHLDKWTLFWILTWRQMDIVPFGACTCIVHFGACTCTRAVVKWWTGGHFREMILAEGPAWGQCIPHRHDTGPLCRLVWLWWPIHVARALVGPICLFWHGPVSRLLAKSRDVPRKLKTPHTVLQIEIVLKWMFSSSSCGFFRVVRD
jgi:hypothetical protein